MQNKENLISNDSHFSAVDTLNREPLAQRVAHFIQQSNLDDEGVTVSIEAPWGDGKSWMLSRIKAQFNGNPNYQAIAFSPWLVGSHEKLTLDFLNTLYAAFNQKTHLQKAALAVATYISGLQSTVDKLAIGVYVGKVNPMVIAIAKLLIAISKWLLKKHTQPNNLPELYEKIRESLSEPKLPKTVVLIDDIDRLQPAEVAEVIRLIQSVGRLPNVVYVLAIEPNYVVEALKQTGHTNAAQFLDKIIQLRITLPRQRYSQLQGVIEETLNNAASSSLFTAFEANGYSLQADWQRYRRPLIAAIDNLRDWKRVWNRFRFVEQGVRGQVNPVELLVLCVIAIKTPKLYAKIISHPHLFAHGAKNYDADKMPTTSDNLSRAQTRTTPQDDARQNEMNYRALQKELGLDNGHLIWRLVDNLFPMLQHPNYASRPHRALGQLQVYTNLRLALNGDGLNDQLPNADIQALLFEPEHRLAVLEPVKTNRYLWDDLMLELDKRLSESHEFAQPAQLLAMLAELDLLHESHGFRIGGVGVDGIFRNWLDNILNRSTNEVAAEFIESVVTTLATNYAGNLVLSGTLEAMCSDDSTFQRHYFEGLRKVPSDEQKLIWSDAFGEWCISELDKGTLKNKPQADELFWCLKQISKEHFYKIAQTQQRFSTWCEVMCRSTGGGNDQTRYHSVSIEMVDDLGGCDIVKKLLVGLPDEPTGMVSWKAALANPNKKYRVGTSADVSRYF